MSEDKKFLDAEGVGYLWKQLSLNDYPNNETLVAVINAIDEAKADKDAVPTKTSDLDNDSGFVTNSILEEKLSNVDAITLSGKSLAELMAEITARHIVIQSSEDPIDELGIGDDWDFNDPMSVIEAVPYQYGTLIYNNQELSPSWNNYNKNKLTIGGTLSGVDAGNYNVTFTPKEGYKWSDGTTGSKIVIWSIDRALNSISISHPYVILTTLGTTATVVVTRKGDGIVSAESSNTAVAMVDVSGTDVKVTSVGNGETTITINVADDTNYIDSVISCTVRVCEVSDCSIYGVEWDGSSTTKWLRTDAATIFEDPTPAIANGTGDSPFDNLYPWNCMERVVDAEAGELVAIPKFWYRFSMPESGAGLKLQIADKATDGFYVSPAHSDRDDGHGERDVVYVGRYHCNSSYKSMTDTDPITYIECSKARNKISRLGGSIWQWDFALWRTIQMLYLVEFADWNSQVMIGYGCSANNEKAKNGATDVMQYHTGTTAASRTIYGYTQYRNIEGLWDNVCDWLDGVYNNNNGINIIMNPMNYNDYTNSVEIGLPSLVGFGYPSSITIPSDENYNWAFYASELEGSDTTYITDQWQYEPYYPYWSVGGAWYQDQYNGLFQVNCLYYAQDYCGCRLQKIP